MCCSSSLFVLVSCPMAFFCCSLSVVVGCRCVSGVCDCCCCVVVALLFVVIGCCVLMCVISC